MRALDMATVSQVLPTDVLTEHVWPRVHQLGLIKSLRLISLAGPGVFEDLPDLVSDDVTFQHVFTKDEYIPCMTRVTEVLSNIQ